MRLHVPIGLRWSDLDAYGHVNNASMLRILEEARIQAFWVADDVETATGATTAVLGGRAGSGTLTLIARQEIEYLVSIPYLRQPLDVQLWLGRLAGASLEVCYEVRSPLGADQSVLFTRASTTIVLVDATSQRPRRINDVEKTAWAPYLGQQLRFTRRV